MWAHFFHRPFSTASEHFASSHYVHGQSTILAYVALIRCSSRWSLVRVKAGPACRVTRALSIHFYSARPKYCCVDMLENNKKSRKSHIDLRFVSLNKPYARRLARRMLWEVARVRQYVSRK